MLPTIHSDDLNSAPVAATIGVCQVVDALPPKPEKLTETEAERLAECEDAIEQVRRSVYLAGLALITIRDERLYREHYPSFEDYVVKRWKRSRGRAYQMIDQADVSKRLSNALDTEIIVNARQAQLLKPFPDGEMAVLWARTLADSADGKVATKQLKALVDQHRAAKGGVSPSTPEPRTSAIPGPSTFNADQARKALAATVETELRHWPKEHLKLALDFLASIVVDWADGKRG
jgi:hypothetical protein